MQSDPFIHSMLENTLLGTRGQHPPAIREGVRTPVQRRTATGHGGAGTIRGRFTRRHPPETVYERVWTKYLRRLEWENDPANRAAMGERRRMPDDREDWKHMRGAVWSGVRRRAQGLDE